MTATLNEKISEASARNAELLKTLSRTDYAVPGLAQNNDYIRDLQVQIKSTDAELVKLHGATDQERKEHIKIRDSTSKRLMAKLGGSKGKEKHALRLEKEERDFLEAWQREREAQERRGELEQALQAAEKDQQNLQGDVNRHEQAQKDLDALYESIFAGPTPEIPHEDDLEQGVGHARQAAQQAQAQLGADKAAFEALTRADRALAIAYDDIMDALKQSERDMWLSSSIFDMMERDALSRSQNNVTQALRHLNDAARAQPAIRQLSDVNIDQGHFISDVLFDNIFSDMNQHARIEGSEADLRRSIDQLRQQISEQQGRVEQRKQESEQAERNLTTARQELQRVRAEAFQQHANGIDVSAPPPAYAAA